MKRQFTLLSALLLLCGVWAHAQIWSETFADSLDGWTLEDHSSQQSGDLWAWTNIGPQGQFSIGPIMSTTADDGWAIFDSDLLCSGSQNAWLISPTIDLTGHDTVVLFFEQYYAMFFSQTFVQVSNDDGATWTAIEVNQELTVNQGTDNPSVVEIDISQYVANSPTARIAFQFLSDEPGNPQSGCAYAWQIDDIRLESQGTPPPPADPNVVWGGPGDPNSEFDGGMNDWTAVGITYPEANWVWEADGKADQGAFSAGTGTAGILSPSVDNGAMVFDSDFYDNGGDPNNIGGGPYPAPQVAELISPVMDLEGEEALAVEFNQYTRNFQSTYAVAWSMDGGATWSDPIFFNQDIDVNEQTTRDDVVRVPLKGASGSSQFRIKFIYEGNYYFWIIDDVKIVRRTNHEMRINDNWYAIAPNYQTPVTQREPFGFLADIENVGAFDETNVKLHMVIRQVGGDTVYTDYHDYGTIARDSLAENQSFGNFLPPDMTGIYRAEYVLEYDSIASDLDPDNNVIPFFFEISDSTFAKEDGGTRAIYPAAGNWDPGEPRSWAYGNFYHIPEGGMVASSASFALGNAADVAGELLYVALYKWTDLNEDAQCDPDERTLVGINLYEIQGNEVPIIPVTVGLADLDDEPVVLEANTDYVLMLEYVAQDETEVDFVASDEFDYGAMILNSQQMGAPRYAAMLGINGDLTVEPYSSLGFGWDLVPVVRLNVTELPNATREPLLEQLATRLTPNPASEYVQVELPGTTSSVEAELRLIDTRGRLVQLQQTRLGAGQQARLDLRDLPTGTYFLLVRTKEGVASRKLQIAH